MFAQIYITFFSPLRAMALLLLGLAARLFPMLVPALLYLDGLNHPRQKYTFVLQMTMESFEGK